MVNKRERNTRKEGGGKRRCEEGEEKHIKRRELHLTCEEVNIREEKAKHASTSGIRQLTVRGSLEFRG